jgi:serine/threonine-protein kinase
VSLPAIGARFAARYQIDALIGEGGFGAVYAATDTSLGRAVAIKVLARTDDDPTTLARFLQEARAAASLPSDHVAIVHEVAVDEGVPYIVMERLRGRDLEVELHERGKFLVEEAVDVVLQAALGVAHAHARDVVHRDLKPRNLFVAEREDGTRVVKLLDFGIAKLGNAQLTESGNVLGTVRYMAPEQLRGARGVNARADQWALGVVLYELLSGEPIIDAESSAELGVKILSEPHVALRARVPVPKELSAVVDRCLAKEPADRFADVGAFAEALAPWAPDGSIAARIRRVLDAASSDAEMRSTASAKRLPAAPLVRGDPQREMLRLYLATAALVLCGGIVGTVWWVGRAPKPPVVVERSPDAMAPDAVPDVAPDAAIDVDAMIEVDAAPPDAEAKLPATTDPRVRELEFFHLTQVCQAFARTAEPPYFIVTQQTCGELAVLGCTEIERRCNKLAVTASEKTRCATFVRDVKLAVCNPQAAADRVVIANPTKYFDRELKKAFAACGVKSVRGTIVGDSEGAACTNIPDAIVRLCDHVADKTALAKVKTVTCTKLDASAPLPSATLRGATLAIETHNQFEDPEGKLQCAIAKAIGVEGC